MPLTNYTTKTTGKVRKLVDFECPNCGNKEEFFEIEQPWCACCELEDGTPPTMRPVFTTKNNAQRAYVRDERID